MATKGEDDGRKDDEGGDDDDEGGDDDVDCITRFQHLCLTKYNQF